MRISFFVIVLIAACQQFGFGQEMIMDKTVTKEMFKMNSGPNSSRFTHAFLSLSSFIKTSDRQAILAYPGSVQIGAGARTKYKIAEWYALGYELEYRFSNFRYAASHDNLPLHEKDKILTHSLAIGVFQRFNFDKRGNYIGKFLDLGAYAELPFSKSNVMIDHLDTIGSGQQKLILGKLKYMSSLNYGVSARIGFNRIVFFAIYRLSDIFKPGFHRQDLPGLNVGLQLGLHK